MYFFDGADDRIEYPSAMLTPKIDTFSGAAWVDLDNAPDTAADSRTIMSISANSDPTLGDHCFRFQIGDHGSADDTTLGVTAIVAGAGTTVQTTTMLPLNGITHVAFTYDGSNVRFYINGRLDATVAMTQDCAITGTQRFQLGAVGNAPGNRLMQGYIGEASYWDRVITEAEIGSIAIGGRSAMYAAPEGLKFYATLADVDIPSIGSGPEVQNLIEGSAGTVTGAALAALRKSKPDWKTLLVRTSPADGMIKYTGGTQAQALAGTSTGEAVQRVGGNGQVPQGQGAEGGETHTPFGMAGAGVYQMFWAFDFHRTLPPNAVIGNAGFVGRNGIDNTATVTNVCELREYDFGVGYDGSSGALELADYIVNTNLPNYTLLATKTSAPAGRFGANTDVFFDSVLPAFRKAIRRDKFTQFSLTTDRNRLGSASSDDETIHFILSECAGTGSSSQTFVWVQYYLEPVPDYRQFPHPKTLTRST